MGIPAGLAIEIGVEILNLALRAKAAGEEVSEIELNEAVARRKAAKTTWEKSKANAAARREATGAEAPAEEDPGVDTPPSYHGG